MLRSSQPFACTRRLPSADAAWVRYSAASGLLRLARAYDHAWPASLLVNLALTVQEPLAEPRQALIGKLARMVTWLAHRPQPQDSQRAAQYAAMLALVAVDPVERHRAVALRALREYVLHRRCTSWCGGGVVG